MNKELAELHTAYGKHTLKVVDEGGLWSGATVICSGCGARMSAADYSRWQWVLGMCNLLGLPRPKLLLKDNALVMDPDFKFI